MKCRSCDCILNDREATRKYASTGEFLDLCDSCFEPIRSEVNTVERFEMPTEDSQDED